jgi:hypothetical protein
MSPDQLNALFHELQRLQREQPLTKIVAGYGASASARAVPPPSQAIPKLHFWGEQLFCIGALPTKPKELAGLFQATFANETLFNIKRDITRHPFVFVCFSDTFRQHEDRLEWDSFTYGTEGFDAPLPIDWFFQKRDPAVVLDTAHTIVDDERRHHCRWSVQKTQAPPVGERINADITHGKVQVDYQQSDLEHLQRFGAQKAEFLLCATDKDAPVILDDRRATGLEQLCDLLSPTRHARLGYEQTIVLLDRTQAHQQAIQMLLIIELARFHQFYFETRGSHPPEVSAGKIHALIQRLFNAFPGVTLTTEMIEASIKSADTLYDKYIDKLSSQRHDEATGTQAKARLKGHETLLAFERKFFGNPSDAAAPIVSFQRHLELVPEQQAMLVLQFIQKWVMPTVLRLANAQVPPRDREQRRIKKLAKRYFDEFRHPDATHPRMQCALLWSLFSCPDPADGHHDPLSTAIAERWQTITGLPLAMVTDQVMYMVNAFFRDGDVFHDSLNKTFREMRVHLLEKDELFDEELRREISDAVAHSPLRRDARGSQVMSLPSTPVRAPTDDVDADGNLSEGDDSDDADDAALRSPSNDVGRCYTPVRTSATQPRNDSSSPDGEPSADGLRVARALFSPTT